MEIDKNSKAITEPPGENCVGFVALDDNKAVAEDDVVMDRPVAITLQFVIASSGEFEGEMFCEAGDVGPEHESLGVVLRCGPMDC
ncbi:hypothetical protein QR98_0049930 [Sarcoptes scabiei]|uniref:Uncharacterized protein n=1 Tax=Sarcoptes scabiei TaxID=52283 RepID=A0A132A6B4_SARSC|nr:hypothetical protein QR98_0049930 [Sarcoptes scabiei]